MSKELTEKSNMMFKNIITTFSKTRAYCLMLNLKFLYEIIENIFIIRLSQKEKSIR